MLFDSPTSNSATLRCWLIRWMYAAAIVHFLVGVVLAWLGHSTMFEGYLHGIDLSFWGESAPAPARAQQLWWIALFGATVQSFALYMLALIHLADRHRSRAAWGWLIVGLIVWAPQDIAISLQADIWLHLWLDCFALASLLPPLIWLYRHDRASVSAESACGEPHHV